MVRPVSALCAVLLAGCTFGGGSAGSGAAGDGGGESDGTTANPPVTASDGTRGATSSAPNDDGVSTTGHAGDGTTAAMVDTGDASTAVEPGSDSGSSTTGEPDPEVCDGVDNDGDGGIDEGSPQNAACEGCTFTLSADGATYFAVCTAPLSWDDARDACQTFGAAADLAIIDSEADQTTLLAQIAEDHWIGLTDAASEGDWHWVDGTVSIAGGMHMEYDGWAAGQPSGRQIENCAELDGGKQAWADSPCDQLQPRICEHPA